MRWILGCCFGLMSACQCGADASTVIVVPLPTPPPEAVLVPATRGPEGAPQAGWVEQLADADRATRTDQAGNVSQAIPRESGTSLAIIAQVPDDAQVSVPDAEESLAEEPDVAAAIVEDTSAAASQVADPAAGVEPIPWLEQYRADYLDRQITLSDVTARIANAQFGVYVEDYRALGAEVGTPHQTWLTTRDMLVVSPSIEALLLARQGERLGQVPTFSCDASRYACRSLAGAPVAAYYRFAPFGTARTIQLVGVMQFDPGARSAITDAHIDDFNGVIDRELRRRK